MTEAGREMLRRYLEICLTDGDPLNDYLHNLAESGVAQWLLALIYTLGTYLAAICGC